MRIVFLHNHYQLLGGEDGVFDAECKLLESKGHEVFRYERHNDEIKDYSVLRKVSLFWKTVWSSEAYRQIRETLRVKKPDVAHFHNIFPLISPAAYYACETEGVPVVQTLHNYRIFCSGAKFVRDGNICEKCIGHAPWRGIFYGCYRNSRLQTLPVAAMEWVHSWLTTWIRKVDTYIALTEGGREKLIEGGLPAQKIVVKPNFLPHPPKPSFDHNGFVVFLGRLDAVKGLRSLLDSWQGMRGTPLKIIGDGPLWAELEEKKRQYGLSEIEFLGRLSFEECVKWLKQARFMVMPSLWYEMFPLTIREAFACGKAVLASNLGSMAELVADGKTGRLFNPGDHHDLAQKARWMIENEEKVIEMGKSARAEFDAKYTAERNYEILMGIYERAIENRRLRD